ncbi:histidine kinase [Chthoniobacter flavus Ellin428]|uniref:histidine kinase n=1 Tax=Chthoniobacter flavus Ellin428 TaxID=497964 RepID=B4D4D8_9BACT|nr:response regulator [Chthoniobacter flavus]EDY18739.1 histidine kinase [Chthoniobacter flavus Ellin428]TCO89021.1 phospho-acceptor domain-containing protein [Chthoniobacter flavus]
MQLPKSTFESARVLIVDDDVRSSLLIERMLRGHFQVHIVNDERETFEAFERLHPDILLLDIYMPHMDGFEIMRKLRESLAADDFFPILVLTGDQSPDTKLRALSAGAKDFLHKPLDAAEVTARIRNLLETRFLHLELQSHNIFLEERVHERTAQLESTLANLRTTQAQVIKQERLAALGVMASGIAHDFNNTLSSILGYGELLLESPDHTDYLKRILSAGHDARQIVRRLREFYKVGNTGEPLAAVHLNPLIDQAVTLTMPRWNNQALTWGAHITVKREFRELPILAGNPVELRELFTNLIFNAVDALPHGGQILIRTAVEGETIVVRVTDDGLGMDGDTARRCMEPFFTTKGEQGTGLGLSVAHGIVKRHKGTIHIETEPHVGTTVILRFPVSSEVTSPETLPITPALERPLKILFVDDQPIISELVSELLRSDGHAVDTAGSGGLALEKCQRVNYDLVITDLAMPGMNGGQLAGVLRQLNPAKPIIMLTGFADLVGEAGPGTNIDRVLAKPASLEELRRAIFEVFTQDRLVKLSDLSAASPNQAQPVV